MAPCEGPATDDDECGQQNGRSQHGGSLGTAPSIGRFKDRPTGIDDPLKNASKWLDWKRIDDDVGPYWRVHDKLYDLTDFIQRHPGGKDWLEMTKGTDITEAFESSHISLTAEKILPKYFVKDIGTPRNSPYTFHEDGFYRTLKRKVRPVLQKIGQGPTRVMLLMQDTLVFLFVSLAVVGSLYYSYTLSILSGIFLAHTIMCAHNFFHQKDNFRMYYFDLSLLSSNDWRVSHGLSHHLFTNTRYDLEITVLEPILLYMPKAEKNFLQRYGPLVYQFVLYPILLFLESLKNIYRVASKQKGIRPENLLPVLELMAMCTLAPSVAAGFRLWLTIHAASSTWFAGVGLLVAHHHPEIYHEGDRFREHPDWGLCQLDAVRDRIEVKGNLFLVSTTFGDHSLHHLFPTVDHSKLSHLYPAFFETCREFDIPHEFLSQWELALGMYQQLARNTPNTSAPGYKAKHD